MSTEQERSFIAHIACDNSEITFFEEELHESWFQLRSPYDHRPSLQWNWLTTNPGNFQLKQMIVYFRCYENYYNLQIRSAGYFGKFFSTNREGTLGAYTAAGGKTTSFNLLDASFNIITLDDIKTNTTSVYMKARNSGVINGAQMYDPDIYSYGNKPGDPVKFDLTILERNVPYPTDNEPYRL
ncbi:hypothetical protein H7698_25885 [Pseudomonas sp. p50]|jgi:hypothetical protein|uniref:hypothetical protein n=1 Tax=Pseudomonas sp. p50(2008) TaxID=2816832 RepID=UPI00188DA786|nr:hypothetical protein [Pseudomonas sp. p50(2008)]MBF4559507.1 hypothetical protein [Pseudomonas sp. p50(2008)]